MAKKRFTSIHRQKLRGRFEMRLTPEQERILREKGGTRWVKEKLFGTKPNGKQ